MIKFIGGGTILAIEGRYLLLTTIAQNTVKNFNRTYPSYLWRSK